jgi:hypothetical protein
MCCCEVMLLTTPSNCGGILTLSCRIAAASVQVDPSGAANCAAAGQPREL